MKRAAGAAATAVALVAAGTAVGAAIKGTNGPDVIAGTPRPDRVRARAGNDRVAVQQGGRDRVSCGTGRDVVTASPNDRVSRDCEVVSRQLSRDRRRDPFFAQHETQLEPDSFSYGSTTVAVFQSGRYADGGSTMIGYATSTNGGHDWRSGFLPGLTRFSPRPRAAERVSDPSIAYDAAHGVWLAASLVFDPSFTALTINRSANGTDWSEPADAARAVGGGLAYDKEWIACDSWRSSPFRGRCYLSYTDVRNQQIVTQFSSDGGRRWSKAVRSPAEGRGGVGAQPVIRPDGTVLVFFVAGAIIYSDSHDGGTTFSSSRLLANTSSRGVPRVREVPLPSADVASDGSVYIVWHDCALRAGCSGDDVVLTVSRPGQPWSNPARLPTGSGRQGTDDFVPAIAADPLRAGRLAVLYYSRSPRGRLSAWLLSSSDGGASWTGRTRLTSQGIRRRWLAKTPDGAFLGDYVSVSFTDGRPVPVFSAATTPVRGRLRQAIFATTRGL